MSARKGRPQKAIHKRLKYNKYGFVKVEVSGYNCPRCGRVLNAGKNYHPNYCDRCGQKLSFKDVPWYPDIEIGYVMESGEILTKEGHAANE